MYRMQIMMEQPLEEVIEAEPVIEAKPEIENINLSSDDLFAITNSVVHLGEIENNTLADY